MPKNNAADSGVLKSAANCYNLPCDGFSGILAIRRVNCMGYRKKVKILGEHCMLPNRVDTIALVAVSPWLGLFV